jgi:hypothetical protein
MEMELEMEMEMDMNQLAGTGVVDAVLVQDRQGENEKVK